MFGRESCAYLVVDVIGASGEMLVHQVERVPSEEDGLLERLSLTVSSEGLVHELANVELNSRLEAFLLHPLATVAGEGDVFATHSAQVSDELGSDQVGLARVRQDADAFLRRKVSSGKLVHLSLIYYLIFII